MGYRLAGFQPRLAVEWDDHAAACYRLNFPSTPLFHGDVGKLSDAEALEFAGLAEGELSVLDGSPPCQGFSTAGNRQLADGRNHLFLEYVRLLKAFRPRAMVMENVPGIALGKMKLVFLDVMGELRAAGYRVRCAVLNAADYGVPQARRRAIFVGVRDDLDGEPAFPAPCVRRHVTVAEALGAAALWQLTGDDTRPIDAEKPALTVMRRGLGSIYKESVAGVWLLAGDNAGDRVETDVPSPTVLKSSLGKVWNRCVGVGWFSSGMNATDPPRTLDEPAPTLMKSGIGGSASGQFQVAVEGRSPMAGVLPAPPLTGKALAVATLLKEGGRGPDVAGKGQWFSASRLSRTKPSSTVMKGGGLFDRYPSMRHPTEVRGLSVGEVMRLQSFPDDYRWPEGTTWSKGWARVGNSVPPLMMRAIALHVRVLLAQGGADVDDMVGGPGPEPVPK
jgi:site-specific DNA-cytosine methylase